MNAIQTMRKEWHILVIILLGYAILPFIWDTMPDRVPIHWNMEGEADGFAPKSWGLLLNPTVALLVYLLLLAIPWLDPKNRVEQDQKPMPIFRTVLPVLFVALHFLIVAGMLFESVDLNYLIYILITLLLLVLGNYMGTIKPNYFVGIRTPWTLESETVWKQTHRLTGKVWITTSLLLLATIPFVSLPIFGKLFFGAVLIDAIVPIIYSFILSKQLETGS